MMKGNSNDFHKEMELLNYENTVRWRVIQGYEM